MNPKLSFYRSLRALVTRQRKLFVFRLWCLCVMYNEVQCTVVDSTSILQFSFFSHYKLYYLRNNLYSNLQKYLQNYNYIFMIYLYMH